MSNQQFSTTSIVSNPHYRFSLSLLIPRALLSLSSGELAQSYTRDLRKPFPFPLVFYNKGKWPNNFNTITKRGGVVCVRRPNAGPQGFGPSDLQVEMTSLRSCLDLLQANHLNPDFKFPPEYLPPHRPCLAVRLSDTACMARPELSMKMPHQGRGSSQAPLLPGKSSLIHGHIAPIHSNNSMVNQ